MAQNGQINIRINENLKQALIKKAKEDGFSLTEVTIKLFQQYLNDKVSVQDLSANNELTEVKSQLSEVKLQLSEVKSHLAKLDQHFMGELAA